MIYTHNYHDVIDMTEITSQFCQTIVVNKDVPWQRVLAGICVDAEIATIEEFISEDPLPTRETTRNIFVFDVINDVDIARRVREKKKYQRVYLCGGYNLSLTELEADRTPVELEPGIYRWSMPALPAMINGWAGAIILHIVAKYLCAEHPHCEYSHQFCEDFITDVTAIGDPETKIPEMFFDDITVYEDKIRAAAARGEGRRLERALAAKTILEVASVYNSTDNTTTVYETRYDNEVAALAAKKQLKVVFRKK